MYAKGYIPCNSSKCNCDMTIINNINITVNNILVIVKKCEKEIADIKKRITNIESNPNVWTEEDMHYVQEQTLKSNLAVANHDIKIVRILEENGMIVTEPKAVELEVKDELSGDEH